MELNQRRRFLDPNIARKGNILNEHLDKQSETASPALFSLIEFNLSGLCNRTCVFCPRVDPKVFPNTNEHLSIELYEKIMGDLKEVRFDGTILYSAFSEPLLHKNVELLLQTTRKYLPNIRVEMVCNGDLVTPDKLRQLFSAGLTTLSISMYDGPHQQEFFEAMKQEVGLKDDQLLLRIRWLPPEEHFGITLSNRGGTLVMPEVNIAPLKEPLKQRCHYPFYQILVDHDGTVLLCPHDWGKKLKVGDLGRQSIQEIWDGQTIKRVRLSLAKGDRNFPPCASCDVDGTLMGQSHFDRWLEYYGHTTPSSAD